MVGICPWQWFGVHFFYQVSDGNEEVWKLKWINCKCVAVLGLQSFYVSDHTDLTVRIDIKKYQSISSFDKSPEKCLDVDNREYRKCGHNCVLGCRFDTITSKNVTSEEHCNDTECVEGCFCKNGFVHFKNKCILATECPHQNNGNNTARSPRQDQSVRHLGIFGCGPGGCKPSVIEIHNYNDAAAASEGKILQLF